MSTIVPTLYMTCWGFLTQKATQHSLFLLMWLNEWLPSRSLSSHDFLEEAPWSMEFSSLSANLLLHILSNIYKTWHESETVLSQYAPVRKFNTNSIHSLKWSTELKLRNTCTLLEHCISISCHIIVSVLRNKRKFWSLYYIYLTTTFINTSNATHTTK